MDASDVMLNTSLGPYTPALPAAAVPAVKAATALASNYLAPVPSSVAPVLPAASSDPASRGYINVYPAAAPLTTSLLNASKVAASQGLFSKVAAVQQGAPTTAAAATKASTTMTAPPPVPGPAATSTAATSTTTWALVAGGVVAVGALGFVAWKVSKKKSRRR